MRLSLATLLLVGATPALAHDTQLSVPYSAPANFTAHGQMFHERINRVGTTPVWQVEFQGMNLVVVEGKDGLILLDTGMNMEVAQSALSKIRAEISDKPIKAIIYTHHHPDHVNGASVFASRVDVAAGKIPIYAASNFLKELSDEGIATLPIVATRAAYMFGFSLTGKEASDYHVGCCGSLNAPGKNESGYIPPTQFVEMDGARDIEIAGVKLHLFHTGGEAASHIAAWLPDHKILISGDEVQGPTFPNLHSMRGTKMRDANRWIIALRRMQNFDSAYMVPMHGPVVAGRSQIANLLSKYEDAIQYTHDQSIRMINKGIPGSELPQQVGDLPEYLRSEPYTTEYYGTVADAVRSYYVGYVSWFSGDATEFSPTPRGERAKREVEMMGGRHRVLDAARRAFDENDAQWSAELSTLLISVDQKDMDARNLKAAAFRKLGYATYNSNRRGFYLMGALELEGKINSQNLTARYTNPENIRKMPPPLMFESIRYRIDPMKAVDKNILVNIDITDQQQSWALQLRNSTLKVISGARTSGRSVKLNTETLGRLITGAHKVNDLSASGDIMGEGVADLEKIFSTIDFSAEPITLVTR